MSTQNLKNVRLRRAIASVVEKLEERRLMASQLPYTLDFDVEKGGILDKDGQGTGFTSVQVMNDGTQYQPSQIDLQTVTGVLKLTAKGTATAGSNYDGDSSLKNGLETSFDASAAGGFTMSVRLKGPLTNFNFNNNQAGITFGVDQDNYVKLVATNISGGNYVQFVDETKTGSSYTHSISLANSLYNIGPFNAVESLDLILVGDPASGKVSAFYRVNDGPQVKVAAELTLTGTKKTAFFNTEAKAGLIVIKKSNNSPDFTATFDRFEITAGTPLTNRPAVIATRPSNTDTGVSPDAFVAADINLPTPGKGVDSTTLTSDSVRLYRTSDHQLVNAVLNTDAAGGSIVLQPTDSLDPNTSYTFEINDLLKDTNGAGFLPYTMSFTTGQVTAQPDSSIAFEKITLNTAAGQKFTGVSMGPDGKLYANTDSGDIYRWSINADGTLGAAQVITTIKTANAGAPRLVSGVAFDPTSTAGNLVLWVVHSDYAQQNATDYSGKITRLTGANLQTAADAVINLPRSTGDHTSNQPVFGPDGKMYFQQGSKTAMGAPDNAWGLREESILSSAILQIDTVALNTRLNNAQGSINVLTTDAGGTYNPYAAGSLVKLYATGVRNAYNIFWHSNGHLYAPTNGSAAGGALPATATTPAIPKNNQTQDDWLYDVVEGGYYGHPNPSRGELVAHGGNPTAAVDANEIEAYPVGTQPAANYIPPAFVFGKNYSPNGALEYKSETFGGALKGKMLVVRYSGGDDILVLDVNANGTIGAAQSGLAGMTHFTDPLDAVENTATGFLYGAEYGGSRITLLRPITPGANINVTKNTYYFNDIRGDGAAAVAQTIKITNTGTQPLALTSDGLTIGGVHANQFTFINKPSLPRTIAPGASLNVQIAMNASSTGLKTATLTIKSNDPDQPNTIIDLRGIGTTGTGGQNEPSLQAILNLYNIPIATGDANPANTDLYNANEPLGANDEAFGMERLQKADVGPITITPLAVMGVATNPSLRFGFYEAGTGGIKTELFTVPTATAQSVNPTIEGLLSFDPGAKSFGLYTTWPNFKAANGTDLRDVFSEDQLNKGWDSASPHKYRFYQMKNADGSVVPNTFVVAVEEFNAGFDSNDIVFVISNVRAAAAGPEIGYENLDAIGFANWMAFNRVEQKNTTTPDVTHDLGTLRLRNTGTQDLVINQVTATTGWTVLNPPTQPLAPGATYDLQVKFVAAPSTVIRTGILSIQSNDADEPTLDIKLGGFSQIKSESNEEPLLPQIVAAFGYSTKIVNIGQSLDNGGKLEAVGDEILSQYWQRADSHQEIQVRQLAAFHTQGNTATLGWYAKGGGATNILTHDRTEGQSFLPHKSGTNYATDGFAKFNTTSVFGIKIDGERSDWTQNFQEGTDAQYGHHLRFWIAKDQAGNVIPNTYIVAMDYSGASFTNFDFQDNVYVISNIKPEAPTAVTGLTATGSGGGIALDWADHAGRNLAGFNVYRSTVSNGTFTKVNTVPITASEYNDTLAPSGATSFYKVYAVDIFRTESAAAATSALRTVDSTPPANVTGLAAVGSASGIALTWNANVDADLAGYNIYRSDSENGTFIKLNGAAVPTASYNDVNAPSGVTSFYRVKAVDTSSLESSVSATANAVRTLDTTAPTAPAGVIATGSTGGISLDWSDNTEPDLAGYNVYFSTSAGGGFTKLNTSLNIGSFYTHSTAPANVTSYYRITAVDTNGNESPFSSGSAVRLDGVPPAAPTGLGATGSTASITLDWADNAEPDLAGYNIFRSDSANGTYVKINASLVTSSAFSDTQAPVNATSFYYVVAVDSSGNVSAFSATANANRPGPTVNGTIRQNAGGTTFLDTTGETWEADTGFTSTNSTFGSTLNTNAIANTDEDALYSSFRWGVSFKYTKTGIANGDYQLKLHFAETNYTANNKRKFNVFAEGTQVLTNFDVHSAAGGANRAVVRTFNVTIADGKLDLSFIGTLASAMVSAIELVPVNVSGPVVPAAPTGLGATAASSSQINLAWTDNASNETGYLIERSTDGTNFTNVTTVAANSTTYSNTGLSASTAYFYRVTAVGSPTNSATSNVATATTPATPVEAPAAPTSLVASAISSVAINLTWADNATNETGYRVERSTDGTNFTTAATLGANVTTYGDSGLTASTQYFYRVIALGSSVNSAASNVSSATTQTPTVGTTVRQNAGTTTFVDTAGNTWEADTGFSSTNSTFGTTVNSVAIANTEDDGLYSSFRWGVSFNYTKTVPNGDYQLKLHFAETNYTLSNKRKFNVVAEGTQVLTNFDVFAAGGGAARAVVRTFNVTITDGKLDLSFIGTLASAMVSAIELVPAAQQTPTTPAAATGLSATAISSSQINLAWTDNASNETGYRVERSTDGTNYTTLATLGANVTSYSNTGLNASTQYSYRVVAVGSASNAVASNVAVATTLASTPAVGTTLRINAGGTAYTDSNGVSWSADTGFSTSESKGDVLAVNNTTDDRLFYQRRFANDFTFSTPVANGNYTLKLFFVETFYSTTGSRIFNVSAEGVQVITNLDLVAEAGKLNPVTKTFNVTVADGKLDLRFFSNVEKAIISAIELTPAT